MNNNNLDGPWICDSCGSEIKSEDHGWVEWLQREEGGKYVGRGLRLVHHCTAHEPLDTRCQYNDMRERRRDGSTLSDGELSMFLGSDGLQWLLTMLLNNEVPTSDVIEMIKRLHVPGYEFARLNLENALQEGIVGPFPDGYPEQVDIVTINEWADSNPR